LLPERDSLRLRIKWLAALAAAAAVTGERARFEFGVLPLLEALSTLAGLLVDGHSADG